MCEIWRELLSSSLNAELHQKEILYVQTLLIPFWCESSPSAINRLLCRIVKTGPRTLLFFLSLALYFAIFTLNYIYIVPHFSFYSDENQFLSAVMLRDYRKALKYCKLSKSQCFSHLVRFASWLLNVYLNFVAKKKTNSFSICSLLALQFWILSLTTSPPKSFIHSSRESWDVSVI